MFTKRFGLFCALSLTALVLGCSGGDDKGKGEAKQAPESPDGYIGFMVKSGTDGKIGDIWANSPEKYRNDIKQLLKEATAKTDAEVWNKFMSVAGKLSTLLRTKKDYFLGSSDIKDMPADRKNELAANWDNFVGIFDTLVNSEIKTYEGLKSPSRDKRP